MRKTYALITLKKGRNFGDRKGRITQPMHIRAFDQTDDWPAIWAIIAPVFRAGETYALPRNIPEDEARAFWVERTAASFVAERDKKILGTYYIKPNQQGPGAHVCNCGYITAASARGQGIASRLCTHSLEIAPKLGFSAMQYNLVVKSNDGAIRLWQRHGFDIIGTLPAAFDHPKLGLTDAYVMYRLL